MVCSTSAAVQAQPERRPVEDALELDLGGPRQLGGERAAPLEMLDRQPQRPVRVHQRSPIERRHLLSLRLAGDRRLHPVAESL